MAELHSCRVIEVPEATTGCEANAAGARAAAAPVVAFAEDHSYVDPHWAAALIEAHEGDWAAVGPEVGNANPATMTSWADFVMSYGPWMKPAEGGQRPFLLGHNCSYKRDVLLAAGDELTSMLGAESVFHYRLAAAGHGLYLEPRARVSHLNFSRWTVSLRVQFHSGRVYASSLRSGWSTPRKMIYALASPLIPLVRFGRSLRLIRRPGQRDVVPTGVIPALALGILCDGVGQVMGHIAGVGRSERRLSDYEYRRVDYITAADRRMIETLTAGLRGGNA
jgi:GT2 family glycosyltransferase